MLTYKEAGYIKWEVFRQEHVANYSGNGMKAMIYFVYHHVQIFGVH